MLLLAFYDMEKKILSNQYIILLTALICRLSFIFLDANKNNQVQSTNKSQQTEITQNKEIEEKKELVTEKLLIQSSTGNEISPILKQKIANTNQDIQILEKMYESNKNTEVLKNLINQYAQTYQFDKAYDYTQKLINTEGEKAINRSTYLYIYINSSQISIAKKDWIQDFLNLLQEAKDKEAITDDEYNFYQGLSKIRYKDYDGAKAIFADITTPKFKIITTNIHKAIISYNPSMNIPSYYQDGLVALSLLKNWYFSIAKKISLDILDKNEKYILPYQILSYSHFLTNNRETAVAYFLKLADFDQPNEEMYKFLIGVSYYRNKQYESSIIYLNQVHIENIQTDVYRYLILDYVKIQDSKKATSIRKKLLGQTDINENDFYGYFYNTFYKGYSKQNQEIYKADEQLPYFYINKCYETFASWTNKDICEYGDIGNQLNKNTNPSIIEEKLSKLLEKYKQPYLYEILGDLQSQDQEKNKAKESYAKALTLTTNIDEIAIIKEKIKWLENTVTIIEN